MSYNLANEDPAVLAEMERHKQECYERWREGEMRKCEQWLDQRGGNPTSKMRSIEKRYLKRFAADLRARRAKR